MNPAPEPASPKWIIESPGALLNPVQVNAADPKQFFGVVEAHRTCHSIRKTGDNTQISSLKPFMVHRACGVVPARKRLIHRMQYAALFRG